VGRYVSCPDGFLVEPESSAALTEKMKKVLSMSAQERQVIGDRAKQKLSNFSPAACAHELVNNHLKYIKK
jgi:hypothetical protein